jgi:hypothetical protein
MSDPDLQIIFLMTRQYCTSVSGPTVSLRTPAPGRPLWGREPTTGAGVRWHSVAECTGHWIPVAQTLRIAGQCFGSACRG